MPSLLKLAMICRVNLVVQYSELICTSESFKELTLNDPLWRVQFQLFEKRLKNVHGGSAGRFFFKAFFPFEKTFFQSFTHKIFVIILHDFICSEKFILSFSQS